MRGNETYKVISGSRTRDHDKIKEWVERGIAVVLILDVEDLRVGGDMENPVVTDLVHNLALSFHLASKVIYVGLDLRHVILKERFTDSKTHIL